ncbi:MAG: signal peptidase I [Oscillospiraceae bacterium]|nr:signal peptidase I [Oscillospiraceae bacterium]
MRVTKEHWVPLRTQNDRIPPPRPALRIAFEAASSLMGALLLVFVLFSFLCRPIRVDGSSMLPSLTDGDWLIMTAFCVEPERGRIAVISEDTGLHKPLVKRVIALPGDTVDIDFTRGVVSVNGVELDEPYTAGPTTRSMDVKFPLTVAEGACFVLGDNRNASADSRSSSVGMVDLRCVIGQALVHIPVQTIKERLGLAG